MANLRDWQAHLRARLPPRERGQGLMEHGLIISVVSIAAVVLIMTMGPRVASMFSTAGASVSSDRRRKGGFATVNRQDVLARPVALPVETWSDAADRSVRHVGPAAEDFRGAFEVGDDSTHIALVDGNGVALTAIQGMYERIGEQRAHLASVSEWLATLDAAARQRADSEQPAALV